MPGQTIIVLFQILKSTKMWSS